MNGLTPQLPEGWTHRHVPGTGSTMLDLRQPQYAPAPGRFVLLSTDYQSCGHGQRGTSWEAAAGLNLLFGFRFRPDRMRADRQFLLSEALALAVCRALSAYADGFSVKWPNDVYHHDRKICGMLIEHRVEGPFLSDTLTGVGVNINQPSFRSDAPNPVSLVQITGRPTDRAEVLSAVVAHFDRLYRKLQAGEEDAVHSEYLARLYRRRGFHPYRDAEGEFRARIADVSPLGLLTLERTDGTRRAYAFKEVAAVLPEAAPYAGDDRYSNQEE